MRPRRFHRRAGARSGRSAPGAMGRPAGGRRRVPRPWPRAARVPARPRGGRRAPGRACRSGCATGMPSRVRRSSHQPASPRAGRPRGWRARRASSSRWWATWGAPSAGPSRRVKRRTSRSAASESMRRAMPSQSGPMRSLPEIGADGLGLAQPATRAMATRSTGIAPARPSTRPRRWTDAACRRSSFRSPVAAAIVAVPSTAGETRRPRAPVTPAPRAVPGRSARPVAGTAVPWRQAPADVVPGPFAVRSGGQDPHREARRRPGQPGQPVRGNAPQHRLDGARPARRPPRAVWSRPPARRVLDDRAADQGPGADPGQAPDLHERLRRRGAQAAGAGPGAARRDAGHR